MNERTGKEEEDDEKQTAAERKYGTFGQNGRWKTKAEGNRRGPNESQEILGAQSSSCLSLSICSAYIVLS